MCNQNKMSTFENRRNNLKLSLINIIYVFISTCVYYASAIANQLIN